MTIAPARPTVMHRWRAFRWIGSAVVVIVAVAFISVWLTAPRPGGRMDPAATSADGAHALVALLRDHGVDVSVADTVADARRATRPDSLLLVAQTDYLPTDDLLRQLADAPGDRLIVEPGTRTRELLAPDIRRAQADTFNGRPDCDLREANRAGTVQLGSTDAYESANDHTALTRCYGGALVRYQDGDRTITVVGSADFMTNGNLLDEGNAALAMNLAGGQPHLVWYAPQHVEGDHASAATIFDLIPSQVDWLVWQLWLTVGLVALWKARRVGPLVAERLPVVVRASETVEGRGRLYRSRRARDRAAEALRTAALQRLTPRLGLGTGVEQAAVVQAIVARCGGNPEVLQHSLFGPPPATDSDLLQLARTLDDIERQVAQS